ncbi:hypothetical protein [Mycolicibacterium celeriflavum]|uniref:hypothetical protein n=1 Tax=Mycolicibacterium celeriflavum TaxID=1249101 RepID=UPI003CEEDDF8
MTTADHSPHVSRRAALAALGLGAAAMATAPHAAGQLDQGYEAMLMKCIDPRFTTGAWKYMTGRGWQNNYSECTFRDEAGRRQPALIVELGIMDLNGAVEVVT